MHMFRDVGLSARATLADASAAAAAASSSSQGFDLDISGVAGFFGADVAISAMATVHVYAGRRWLGWYNQPGSYEVARRYGQLARSRFWDSLYPGPNENPAVLCGIDGTEAGPKFTSVLSGTVKAKTCNIARLFVEECKAMPVSPHCQHLKPSRETAPTSVTVVRLEHEPEPALTPRLQQSIAMRVLAAVPILVSVGAAVCCGLLGDWFCASMILFGMFANGVSCCVVGQGTLTFTCARRDRDEPALSYGAGLLDDGDDLVLLRAPKGALNALTRSRFSLVYGSAPGYHDLGICAVLLSLQLLAQLLVVPQGELYGQLLFLGSLAVSWAHNSCLSAPDLGTLLRRVLFEEVLCVDRPSMVHQTPSQQKQKQAQKAVRGGARMERYEFGTRTGMVVFALLVLAESAEETWPLRRVLDDLLPNDIPVWNTWKEELMRNVAENAVWLRGARGGDLTFEFPPMAKGERPLLGRLYGDAHAAADVYRSHRR
ncbi:hypothetical protein TRAPUB_11098 [Trametes pubescens]|uniref:Uncharacterized protein n=1 Tax=Trametes pubescens TaxID=154538 RepID=A0A1M2VXM6_TRAPU|nr:hypothetical protein TRAPUB_11098 [Trametes pubescens]